MGLTPTQQQIWLKTSRITGVVLSPESRAYVVARIAADLDLVPRFSDLGLTTSIHIPDYFSEGVGRFEATGLDAFKLFERLVEIDGPAETYFECLSQMELRRQKYRAILASQPLPAFDQVGPRALLQYGDLSADLLAIFLFWRKWLYDIDNRAAQETGYLFEPIVAKALGGVPMSARASPVKRGGTGSGRQVDCLRERPDGEILAYEMKLRVTIAASGQGRFAEELSFAADAAASGITPVLVVFDPTEADRLRDLQAQFARYGGHSYVGDEAWEHLESEAAYPMDVFLDRYVRAPLDTILKAQPDTEDGRTLPTIRLAMDDGQFEFSVGEASFSIERAPPTVPPPPESPAEAE